MNKDNLLDAKPLYTLDNWLDTTDLACAQDYRDVLIEHQVSAETFHIDHDIKETIAQLVRLTIPELTASDIVHSARRYFKKQHSLATAPVAVFWDAENVPIPAKLHGVKVIEHIRSSLTRFGQVGPVRVYLDIQGGGIREDKRSELQLAGCHIIDTPHYNRKEVADKMIIVDSLLYVMANKDEGASLCFITQDTDFAYLLSQLKPLSKFRTILVSDDPTSQNTT